MSDADLAGAVRRAVEGRSDRAGIERAACEAVVAAGPAGA